MNLAAGAVLAGRYRLERKLGTGAMGQVWAAKNIAVGTDVAVKTLLAAASANAEIVMRFRRESFLLARIKNDHVARVLDFATDETFGLVLVMDLVDGQSLAEVLKTQHLSVEEAIDIGIDVLTGMLDLHRANVVHRDLKPGNVILEHRPVGRRRAVIVDFGLGRLMTTSAHEASGITRADMAVGTLEYMAPEQLLNSRNVTGAADIYALGAMLYRAVSGGHVFGDVTNVELAQTKVARDPPPLLTGRDDPVALGFEAVIARAIKRRPADRYTRAEEMLTDLEVLRRPEHAYSFSIEEEPTTLQHKSPFSSAPAPVADPGAANRQDSARPVPNPAPSSAGRLETPMGTARLIPSVVAPPRRTLTAKSVLALLAAFFIGAMLGATAAAYRLTGGPKPAGTESQPAAMPHDLPAKP
jgi:eukaryotic-like serine/threonine-protein kinase